MAIAINQLATPGLGSWLAGYRLAGLGQLVLATLGFLLVCAHMIGVVSDAWNAALQGLVPEPRPAADWQRPMILFGIAWLWAGVTSLQIALRLRREGRPSLPSPESGPAPADVPPRLG